MSRRKENLHGRRGPVRWLAPSVLARSVRPILLSGLFARFSDRREVEAVLQQGVVYRSDADELWVDYVADTGDGFDATATVASLLAPETLTVEGQKTRAGSLLVLGGDEVYPFASMEEYKERLVKPFRAMLPFSAPDHERTVVAVPGNHDWYDGLTAFLQIFCGRQWMGGWKTQQRRSYYACQLPHGWWLWAIDIQLNTYIDHPQIEYFTRMAAELRTGDRIILCWAKPAWVKAAEGSRQGGKRAGTAARALEALKTAYEERSELYETPQAYETLDYFQRHVIPPRARVRLSLTGDSHHYARYRADDGEEKITAGLGGAFLSATHHLPKTLLLPALLKDDDPIRFHRVGEHPSCVESKRLSRGVVRSIYTNGTFALLPAFTYAALALGSARRSHALVTTGAIAAAVVAACVAFSKEPKPKQWGPGIAHGAAHVGVALAATSLMRSWTDDWRLGLGAFGVGAAVGPALFGLYLLAADRIGLFGRNTNELFAALAIEDHKGFLRLHFRSDGGLTIYPIKVDRVSRFEPDGTWPGHPDAPRFKAKAGPVPTFIEEPFEVIAP